MLPLPNLVETIQIESSIIERSLDLPANELAEVFQAAGFLRSTYDIVNFTKLVAAPWERLRTRRVCRIVIAEDLPAARLEPWQSRRPRTPVSGKSPGLELQGSRLTWLIFSWFEAVLIRLDIESVGRRALEQAVALVAWKLDHAGKYPDKLEEIVPGLLDRLPLDPFSGRSFGYIIRSEGQRSGPLRGV